MQTLSWEYWEYASNHPITKWEVPTQILYGENDNLIERDIVNRFSQKFNCNLTVMENGEHWFHTEHHMDVLCRWAEKELNCKRLSQKER
ncbi:TPA: alpha/beta fold hydrolase [Enterococcus faecium]|uniref:alpha/beta fold hydrolase n=1 Tax=Enterococcus TaxID=1350 RepID=UPI003362D6DA